MLLNGLSRLALVGCILAIITALILPRSHNLARILQDILPETLLLQLTQPTSANINDQQLANWEPAKSRPQHIIREPARDCRQTLRQQLGSCSSNSGSKSTSSPAHSVPTPESSSHSAASLYLAVGHQLAETGADGYGLAGQRLTPATGRQATSLTVFTVTVIALILYTAMRMLITRSGRQRHSKPKMAKGYPAGEQSHFCDSKQAHEIHNNTTAQCYYSKLDTRPTKRKLARLSRDERARELILLHGPRNVSQAIRFLTAELEKQRQQLAILGHSSEEHTKDSLSPSCSCSCSCHYHQHHSTSDINGLHPTSATTSATSTLTQAAP